jgi:hypothetical protein
MAKKKAPPEEPKKNPADTTGLEQMVTDALTELLTPGNEADKTKLAAINTTIKWIAVKHKINEDEWGGEFDSTNEEEDANESGKDGNDG